MHLIKPKTIIEYGQKHADAQSHLNAWASKIQKGQYRSIQDLLKDFPSAGQVSDDRIKFKISGNRYRLIASFRFTSSGRGVAYVKFIGTHKEYDEVDVTTVDMF